MIFLEVTVDGHKILLNANNITSVWPSKGKKKKGCYIERDIEDGDIEVEESLEQIIKALSGLDMIRKPSNE